MVKVSLPGLSMAVLAVVAVANAETRRVGI
jgi:hypothetical protein